MKSRVEMCLRVAAGLMSVLLLQLIVTGQTREDPSMTGAITGRVTKAGLPAVGVGVVLLESGHEGMSTPVQRAKTGSDGRFSFRGLAQGLYFLSVHDPGFIVRRDSAGEPNRGFAVGREQWLHDALIELVAGSAITGKAATHSGQPVAGKSVYLYVDLPDGSRRELMRTETDDRGVYRFHGLVAGRFTVGAQTFNLGSGTEVQDIDLVATTENVGESADARPSPIAPAAGSNPRGRGFIRGRVLDERGGPVEGAKVICLSGDRRIRNRFGLKGVSSATGEFEIAGVPKGVFELSVEESPSLHFEPTSHHQVQAGDVVTMRVATGGVITGRVVDEAGRPLARAWVEARRVRGQLWEKSDVDSPMIRNVRTDDRGVYRLWQLTPGTYTVCSSGNAYLADRVRSYHPRSSRQTAAELNVRPGVVTADIDIVFRDIVAPRLTGRIGLVPEGPMINHARVILREPSSGAIVGGVDIDPWSPENPTFSIPVDEDEYVVEASGWVNFTMVFHSARVKVRVDREDVTAINLQLQPMSKLTGRVELTRLPQPPACEPIRTGKVDPSDYYLGPVTIKAWRGDKVLQLETWNRVKYGEPFVVTVGPVEQFRLSITLSDGDVYVVSLGAQPARSRSPNDAVSERLSFFPRDPVRVASGETIGDVLVLLARGAARVRGRVTPSVAGAPLPVRARVCLVPSDPKLKDDVFHYYEVDVDGRGSFEIWNVAPGDYLMVSRVLTDDRLDREIAPAAWDAEERAQLRMAAQKAGKRIRLSPCQRLDSISVRVGAARGR